MPFGVNQLVKDKTVHKMTNCENHFFLPSFHQLANWESQGWELMLGVKDNMKQISIVIIELRLLRTLRSIHKSLFFSSLHFSCWPLLDCLTPCTRLNGHRIIEVSIVDGYSINYIDFYLFFLLLLFLLHLFSSSFVFFLIFASFNFSSSFVYSYEHWNGFVGQE